jgi:hypothetical protein
MVDKLDQGLVVPLPAELGPLDYKGLYNVMSTATFLFLLREYIWVETCF